MLVLDHDEDGALGVVINRPTAVDGRRGAAGLAAVRDATQACSSRAVRSPSTRRSGWPCCPAPSDEEPLGWRRVVGGLGLVDLDTPPEVLARRAEPACGSSRATPAGAPASSRTSSPRARGTSCRDADGARDAFTDEPDALWRAVLRRQGGDLAMVSTYLDDPSLN